MWTSQHKRLKNGRKSRRKLEEYVTWKPSDKMFQGEGGDKCQILWIDQVKQRPKKKLPLDFVTRRSLETWEEWFWRSNKR